MRTSWVTLCVSGLLVWNGVADADVRLPPIFSDHLVIQRDAPVAIWGVADPDEAVAVTIGAATVTARNVEGRWRATLPAQPAGPTPDIVVRGRNTVTITDVLAGEVWIGSGQSNMVWPVNNSSDPVGARAAADLNEVRLFVVPTASSAQPTDMRSGRWRVCSPESVGGFSAVLFWFGQSLRGRLGLPVGLIQSAVGGTKIQPWTPRLGFETEPALKADLKWLQDAGPRWERAKAAALNDYERWLDTARQARDQDQPIPAPPVFPPDPMTTGHQGHTVLFNAMIHPLVPYTMRGVVWYQGEANVGEGSFYRVRLATMIRGWRELWGQGDFPFGIVQLAPYSNYGSIGQHLPALWEAQQRVADELSNCGLVVVNDVATLHDIHPPNKKPVGERLARWALATVYGEKDVEFSGPRFESATVQGQSIRIRFTRTGSGLASRDGKPLTWFTIAGGEGVFVPAEAVIDGHTVVVRSDQVAAPVAARFAWDALAEPNLVNQQGLPAGAFRTDRPADAD